MSTDIPVPAAAKMRRPRDPRLDFFRGLAMFIILLAHTPGNTWTLWIPARFGFSDATEIFVFCSGMASALAFGAVFTGKGFGLGTARIAFRVWQVYWAHIGIILVTATMLFAIDHWDLGNREIPYTHGPYVVPIFEQTGEALIGLFTLTYVPGLFDILPMYLVILAMIPVVMVAHRLGGLAAVLAVMALTWGAANLAGYARLADDGKIPDPDAIQVAAIAVGTWFSWMNLPSYPWGELTWFFNPFGWQIVFFTGFCFAMGWLPAPPRSRVLVWLAAGYLLASLPLAWFKIHKGFYLPADLTVLGFAPQLWIADLRDLLQPFWWKSWIGGARFLHFLAIAYLAWMAVGPRGIRLSEGFIGPPVPGRAALIGAGVVATALLPYALVYEIHTWLPGLETWLIGANWLGLVHVSEAGETLIANPGRIGLLQIGFGIAAAMLLWAAIGARARHWLTHGAFLAAVPVIRKVGTQSLAVFMVSIPLARANGWIMDLIGRDVWTRAGVNLFGFAMLIAVAYGDSWIKRQPWRDAPRSAPPTAAPRPAQTLAGGVPGLGEMPRGGQPVPAQRP